MYDQLIWIEINKKYIGWLHDLVFFFFQANTMAVDCMGVWVALAGYAFPHLLCRFSIINARICHLFS